MTSDLIVIGGFLLAAIIWGANANQQEHFGGSLLCFATAGLMVAVAMLHLASLLIEMGGLP